MHFKGRRGLAIITALILLVITVLLSVESIAIESTTEAEMNGSMYDAVSLAENQGQAIDEVIECDEDLMDEIEEEEAAIEDDSDSAVEEEEGELEEDEPETGIVFPAVTRSTVVNHFMLAKDSSNVILYATTGYNEPLTIIDPGVEFSTTSPSAYFYVKLRKGYGTTSEFEHLYTAGDPDRTEFLNDWNNVQTSTYVTIDTSGYTPNRYDEAFDDNCTYMFQYTGKSGSAGNFWSHFRITATPVIVNVIYSGEDQDADEVSATNIPEDKAKYYHSFVTEEPNKNIIKISSETPSRGGYTFSGWLAPDGNIYNPGDTINVDTIWDYLNIEETRGTLELKAVWSKNIKKVSISYNGNGHTGGTAVKDNQTYNAGSDVDVMANTWRRSNYTFYAWNTEADGSGTSYKPGDTITLNDSTTLYAQWALRGTVPIYYEIQGGASGHTSLSSSQQNVLPEADNTAIIGSTAITYPNSDGEYEYEFLGWSKSVDAADIFQTEAKLTPIKSDSDEWVETTYYAIFKKKPVLTVKGISKTLVFNGKLQTMYGFKIDGDDDISNVEVGDNGSATFVYDDKNYTITGIKGTSISGTKIGTYIQNINVDDVVIRCDGVDVTDKFIRNATTGELKIIGPAVLNQITIAPEDYNFIYDGETHKVSGFKINGEAVKKTEQGAYKFTYNGTPYTIEGVAATESARNAGEYEIKVTGDNPIIRDEEGDDVTDMFMINRTSGKLLIEKKSVVITSASDTKEYDGTALTRNDVDTDIVADGFVGTDGSRVKYTFDDTATQTEVGEASNSFKYAIPGTIASNYDISVEFGTLKVTAAVNSPGGTDDEDSPGNNPGGDEDTPGDEDNPGSDEPIVTPDNPSVNEENSVPDSTATAETVTPTKAAFNLRTRTATTGGAIMATNTVAEDDIIQIDDEATPLGKFSGLSHWALLNLLAALATAFISIVLLVGIFTGRKEDDDDEQEKIRRRIPARIASVVPAVVAFIVFIITENMRTPMVIADKWTLLMIAILAVQIVVALVSKKNKDDNEPEAVEA